MRRLTSTYTANMGIADETPKLDEAINDLLGAPDAALTKTDILWLADVLAPVFPEYTPAELASRIAKAAVERGDRKVDWVRWDS